MSTVLIVLGTLVALAVPVASEDAGRVPLVTLTTSVVNEPLKQFVPAIVRVTLTNISAQPLSLHVREDGLPHKLVAVLSANSTDFTQEQWLLGKEPRNAPVVLGPGESTTGEMLIFYGTPTGFAFSDAAEYRLHILWVPREEIEVGAEPLSLRVLPADEQTVALIEELDEFTYGYSGYDREAIRKANGEAFLVANRMLARIVRQEMPFSIDDHDGEKITKLVNELRELLRKYPSAAYAGYIARYVGLAEIESFERLGSVSGFDERMVSQEERRSNQGYIDAMKHLQLADEAGCWPRMAAATQLARLHAMAHEWEKADAILKKIQGEPEVGPSEEVKRITAEIRRYRDKIINRTTNDRP